MKPNQHTQVLVKVAAKACACECCTSATRLCDCAAY